MSVAAVQKLQVGERLHRLDNGLVIDVRHISLMMVVAFSRGQTYSGGKECRAGLKIETRHGAYTVPCVDTQQAQKLCDTLLHLANKAAAPKPEVRQGLAETPSAQPRAVRSIDAARAYDEAERLFRVGADL